MEIQPLPDMMAGKLQNWKGKLLSKSGRLVLVNSVLTSSTTFFPLDVSDKLLGN